MLLPWADDTLAALLGGAASLRTSANAVGPLSDPFSACMLLVLAMLLVSAGACMKVYAPFWQPTPGRGVCCIEATSYVGRR